ncbi:shikimate dehydrogenase family protein [Flavobacterium crassostreae]|uniref:Shikimate dehydrogenase n=1 Tax=Flavobacterium crassostreae TaxID=1763534 RepID=A0A1B9E9R9_9FLAO|nr:shikimate dehydrogenase [Flavobacterium crassostreae]OCB78683.1 shikimate dehydrogenase [Flavobacterium crassostreae]
MTLNNRKRFGLLGKNISYSFSKGYFSAKFEQEAYENYSYENFDIPEISLFNTLIKDNPETLAGINVTIPYKEAVLPFLDQVSKKAKKIGAVNTIKFTKKGKLKGYNTDYYGFKKSLEPMLESHHKKALILGTGGASKGVCYALKELGIAYTLVSRVQTENSIGYAAINSKIMQSHTIIINATPVGTSPNIEAYPALPYADFSSKHIAYDLIYNPAETQFLKRAAAEGAQTKNGYDMLVFQAEKAWEIWNK